MKKQTNTKKPGAKPAKKQTEARAKLATPPPPIEVAETVAAELPGTSPEEATRAAQAVAIRAADRHKRNAERLASLAEVYNPGIQSDGATRRALLVEAGLLAPDASAAAERRRLAAIQEAIRKTPEAWQVFADEAKKEGDLRDAALARAEKAGDVLRQLETDKRNAELAAAMREHAAALRESARPAPSSSPNPDAKDAKGDKDAKDAEKLAAAATLKRTKRDAVAWWKAKEYERYPGENDHERWAVFKEWIPDSKWRAELAPRGECIIDFEEFVRIWNAERRTPTI